MHIVIANCESSVSESVDDNGQSQEFMTDLDELPEQDTDCNDRDDHDSSKYT